jgi:hypothetical protein
LKNSLHYKVDPFTAVFVPKAFVAFNLFTGIYDIPFYHLLFGLLIKFFVAGSFLLLTWKISRSILACALAEMMLFGLFDFIIMTIDMPLGYMAFGVRKSAYLNTRELAIAFCLLGAYFFLCRRLFLTSLFLAIAFHFNPISALTFFVSANVAFVLFSLSKEERGDFLGNILRWLVLSMSFSVLIFPYLLSVSKIDSLVLKELAPISSATWWEFLLKTEPDDASLLYHITRGGLIKEAVLTVIAGLAYSFLNRKERLPSARLVLPFLFAPWLMVAFAALWEGFLIKLFPDFLNLLIITLQFRRYPTVAALIYIPVLALLMSSVITTFLRFCMEDRFGRPSDEIKRTTRALDATLGVGLACFLLVFISTRGSSRGVQLEKYWNFGHVPYSYFASNPSPYFSAFTEACSFVRARLPLSAAFFNPPYIPWFSAYCERQRFFGEKDETYIIFQRALTTVAIQRFKDISGLTYRDLPGIIIPGSAAYTLIRDRYLSLDRKAIEDLKTRYPGYRYLFTEVEHEFRYPVVYKNRQFIIYDLDGV